MREQYADLYGSAGTGRIVVFMDTAEWVDRLVHDQQHYGSNGEFRRAGDASGESGEWLRQFGEHESCDQCDHLSGQPRDHHEQPWQREYLLYGCVVQLQHRASTGCYVLCMDHAIFKLDRHCNRDLDPGVCGKHRRSAESDSVCVLRDIGHLYIECERSAYGSTDGDDNGAGDRAVPGRSEHIYG